MISAVKAAMVGMQEGARDTARANEARADHARQQQMEAQREAAQQDFKAGMEEITAAKEKAIAQGIGAGIAVATSFVRGQSTVAKIAAA